MKNIYKHVMLALLLVMGTANLYAQKLVSLGDGKKAAATLLVPDNANTKVINEHQALVSFGAEPKNVRHEGRATHNFSINIADGDWQEIHVACGEDYLFNMMVWEGDEYNEIVEEGYYDILIIGYVNGEMNILTYDQVPVFEDIEFDATFNDCIHTCRQHALDPNGNDMTNFNYRSNDHLIYFNWLNGKWSAASLLGWVPYFMTEIPVHFSSCDERNYVSLVVNMHTTKQIGYNINYPIIRGISENTIFENNPELLVPHTEEFQIRDTETSYCHLDFISFWNEQVYTGFLSWNIEETFDSHKSWTMYTDSQWGTESSFTERPTSLLLPTVYENYRDNSYPYENIITPFAFCLDNNGKIMREPFGKFRGDFNYEMPNYLGFFPATPLTQHTEPETTLSFGERTPMVYSQPYALKPEQTFSGQYTFKACMLPIGENGSQRFGDKDGILVVDYEGQEVFNDSLFKWTAWNEVQTASPGIVSYDFRCNHVVIDGIEKSNYTYVEFDMNNDDICAPTMTLLQVKNENGEEAIYLSDLTSSQICFAAGDFSPHYTEEDGYGHFDYMQYDGKPELGVSYSYGNGDFTDLEVKEESSLFHENYGNVFTVDLAQIPADVNNTWVNVQFIFIDEAGNIQQQILSNLFYVGQPTSINEATPLAHTVYPNPFTNEVRIHTAEAINGNASISVFNVLGEQVISKAMNCNETTEFVIDGSNLNAGIYFYNVATENGSLKGRIVKE